MDIVKTLIQSVTRGFYDLRSILIMDALLVHSALSDEELTALLGIQRKDLRAACSKLKDDHMLMDHIQKVEGPGQRPINKTYYYIHHTETVDAIKWKMFNIDSSLKEQMGNDAQPQGYICDTCKTRYSQMEALTNFSPERNEFLCDVCGSVLRQDDSNEENQANQERLGKLMTQIQPIIDDLRRIDNVIIPENTFQSSFAQQIPVEGSANGNARAMQAAMALPASKSRVGDNSINGSAQFTVNITSEQENAELERKQKEEKERMAAENALPSWHVESTVGKGMWDKQNDDNNDNDENNNNGREDSKEDVKKEISAMESGENAAEEDKANEDALAAYYAQLAAQEEEEDDEEEEEEEDDDEDEDEEEFEFEGVDLPGDKDKAAGGQEGDDEDFED